MIKSTIWIIWITWLRRTVGLRAKGIERLGTCLIRLILCSKCGLSSLLQLPLSLCFSISHNCGCFQHFLHLLLDLSSSKSFKFTNRKPSYAIGLDSFFISFQSLCSLFSIFSPFGWFSWCSPSQLLFLSYLSASLVTGQESKKANIGKLRLSTWTERLKNSILSKETTIGKCNSNRAKKTVRMTLSRPNKITLIGWYDRERTQEKKVTNSSKTLLPISSLAQDLLSRKISTQLKESRSQTKTSVKLSTAIQRTSKWRTKISTSIPNHINNHSWLGLTGLNSH